MNFKLKYFIFVIVLLIIEFCQARYYRSANESHISHSNNVPQTAPPTNGFTPAPRNIGKIIKECHHQFKCVPMVSCPAHLYSSSKKFCRIIGGRQGICCNTGQKHYESKMGITRDHVVRIDNFTLGVLTRRSNSEITELRVKEAKLLSDGDINVRQPGSASYSHFRNSRTFDGADLTEVVNVANKALEIAIATRVFKDRQGITNHQLEFDMLQEDLGPTTLGHTCNPKPHCPKKAEKYRRLDGTCNNHLKPSWGTALSPYTRLLPPSYHDGVWSPRVSEADGEPLPSPRLISTTIIQDNDRPNYGYTLMVMQFGQFLSHDITQSIDISFENGSSIACCARNGEAELHPDFRHHACMPIQIPKHDHFYKPFKQHCMNFVRSVLAPRQDCTLGYAQQMNKITHFIDSSSIYGSTPEQTSALRSFEGGRLNVFNDFGRDLLPLATDPEACLTMEQGSACFTSGDTRTNQMVSLVVLHTIFMREHNRVAGILAQLNPHWIDEQLFLEARQIVMAEMQVIIYKEYLPAVIGNLAMEEFQLNLASGKDYANDYDPSVEPSIINEFASAALRFGHSTVEGLLKIYGPKRIEEMIAIPEVMFSPARMRSRKFLDELLSTMTTEPIQDVDNNLSDALTKYMFRAGNPFGVDLAAINIQRGRDHGLRTYNDYRELTGQKRITKFSDLGDEIGEKLQRVYKSVDDIDLWVGGLLEEKAPGALVGHTFKEIIAEQFFRLKKGDRYFFENNPKINPGYFSPDQLFELRKASMSRIICDNSDGILMGKQTINAFLMPATQGNQYFECSGNEIPKVNLNFWQDTETEGA